MRKEVLRSAVLALLCLAGIVGGVMLETVGERWLPAVLLVLLLATLVVVLRQPRAWAPIAH